MFNMQKWKEKYKKLNNIYNFLENQLKPELKNCHIGTSVEIASNYKHNKENVENIIIPLLNWIIITLAILSMILPLEQIKNHNIVYHIIYIFLGMCVSASIVVSMLLIITYLYLKNIEVVLPTSKD